MAELLGASMNATTANSMVERMHRIMKTSLKAKFKADSNWCDALPVMMLGMLAAVKSDIGCSAAEIVYGEQLRLPGEFFAIADGSWTTDPDFVVDLRQKLHWVRPVPPV